MQIVEPHATPKDDRRKMISDIQKGKSVRYEYVDNGINLNVKFSWVRIDYHDWQQDIVLTYSENHFVRHSLTIHNIQSVKQVRENDIVTAYEVVFGEENKVIELYTDKPERTNNGERNEKDGKKNVCMQACPVM